MTALINNKREIRGWMMYDWANSAFSTTVVTALLGPYIQAIAESSPVPYSIFGLEIESGAIFPFRCFDFGNSTSFIFTAPGNNRRLYPFKKAPIFYVCLQWRYSDHLIVLFAWRLGFCWNQHRNYFGYATFYSS